MSEMYAKVHVQQWASANHLIVNIGLQQLGAHLSYPRAFDSDRAVAVAISELLPISVRSVQIVLKEMRAEGSYSLGKDRRVRLHRVQEVRTSVQEMRTDAQEVHTSVQDVHTGAQEVHTERVVGVQEVHTSPIVTCGDVRREVEAVGGVSSSRTTTEEVRTTTEVVVAAHADPVGRGRGSNQYPGPCLYCRAHVKAGEGGWTKATTGKTHAICGDTQACADRVALADREKAERALEELQRKERLAELKSIPWEEQMREHAKTSKPMEWSTSLPPMS